MDFRVLGWVIVGLMVVAGIALLVLAAIQKKAAGSSAVPVENVDARDQFMNDLFRCQKYARDVMKSQTAVAKLGEVQAECMKVPESADRTAVLKG